MSEMNGNGLSVSSYKRFIATFWNLLRQFAILYIVLIYSPDSRYLIQASSLPYPANPTVAPAAVSGYR